MQTSLDVYVCGYLVSIETKAVGGFFEWAYHRIFHNMYVLGNLLSKYIDVRTLYVPTYRVSEIVYFLHLQSW